ncbi:g3512 [Coccomyxa elongata]
MNSSARLLQRRGNVLHVTPPFTLQNRRCFCKAQSVQLRGYSTVKNFTIRPAETDAELRASATLRAESFYTYPPERSFAGKIHQIMKGDEEFAALKEQRDLREAGQPNQKSACLVAVCPAESMRDVQDASSLQIIGDEALLGTLDLYAIRAMPGEVLIGDCSNPAYLANVCVTKAAQRQGVGRKLIHSAVDLANQWRTEALFVHILWVNDNARMFYESLGFRVDKEESSNTAHYRGHCLEGIEGRGRTLMLRRDLP